MRGEREGLGETIEEITYYLDTENEPRPHLPVYRIVSRRAWKHVTDQEAA